MLDQLLSQLEESTRRFDARGAAQTARLVARIRRRKFTDAESLIRFHEALFFARAHPQSRDVLDQVDEALDGFVGLVEKLRETGADMIAFDYIEYSGIAGTAVTGTFSYGIARWLASRFPERVSVDWSRHERKERLGATLPRMIPLLEEDSLVEANIPYLAWIEAARGRERDINWLVRGFERLKISEREKAELYDSLELHLRWDLDDIRAARTRNIRRVRRIFYHTAPLVRRSEVSIEKEINSPPLKLRTLSAGEGEALVDMLREATTVRYRELYGITNGDPRQVVEARVGRGVEIYLWGLAPDRRLPLRAYHAGFTLKNGVPINYIEAITLAERAELGFNTFYTFRDGETAWVYAQVLKLLNQVLGASCFSIDPYQIGFNNGEALDSGAFWFYRKLGFRPIRPELARLAAAEEKKIASDRAHRTSRRTLGRLSTGHIVYELPGTRVGFWDGFQVRNLGLAVSRRMAEAYDGNAQTARAESVERVARSLGVRAGSLDQGEARAFENLALVLALIEDLDEWSGEEKKRLIEIISAKAGRSEAGYARIMQNHDRLKDWLRRLGS
ncbi:MAG TPA: hypothetical protein VKA70_04840 [Blastocatellia bacterium]|nr:hypothetical protein [Blastocatellia bacterium]